MSFLFLMLSALNASAVFAGEAVGPSPELGCEARLLKPLRFTHRPHYNFEIREAAGILVLPDEQIPDLGSSDFFIWQLYTDGSLYIQPKYDWRQFIETGYGLYTHSNFVMEYKRRKGRTPYGQIVMSGEFRTAFGEMVMLNLKSGKFKAWAQEELLPAAERILTERGAPRFTADTKRIILDPSQPDDEGHTEWDRIYDLKQLEMMADVRTHPQGDRVVSLYEELGRVLIKYTDSGTAFGLRNLMLLREVRGRLKGEAFIFVFPFETATMSDGLYFGIFRIWDGMTLGQNPPETYVNFVAPELINNLMQHLFGRLANEDRERLVEIREGFRALPAWDKPAPHPLRDAMRPKIDENWTADRKKQFVKEHYQRRGIKPTPYVPQWRTPAQSLFPISDYLPPAVAAPPPPGIFGN